MCVVSMVSDHFMKQYPQPTSFPPWMYPDYQELLRKAREYDRITGQPDCPAPEKLDWQNRLDGHMRLKWYFNNGDEHGT